MVDEKDDLAIKEGTQEPAPPIASPAPSTTLWQRLRKPLTLVAAILGALGAAWGVLSGVVSFSSQWGLGQGRNECAAEKTELTNLRKEKEGFDAVKKELTGKAVAAQDAMQQQRIADQGKIIAMEESLNAKDREIAGLKEKLQRCDREFAIFTGSKKLYEDSLHPMLVRLDKSDIDGVAERIEEKRKEDRANQLAADRKTYEVCMASRLDH